MRENTDKEYIEVLSLYREFTLDDKNNVRLEGLAYSTKTKYHRKVRSNSGHVEKVEWQSVSSVEQDLLETIIFPQMAALSEESLMYEIKDLKRTIRTLSIKLERKQAELDMPLWMIAWNRLSKLWRKP